MMRPGLTRSTSLREPYRATKLWLEAVAIFRTGVPLGRHRSYWKSYEDCFVAQEAIGWFHKQLQERFERDISRKQTLQLLQKFFKSGIFVPVSTRASYAEDTVRMSPIIKETDFKDNGALYRLSGYTSDNNGTLKQAQAKAAKKSPAGRSRRSLPKEQPVMTAVSASQLKYNVVINPLSLEQVHLIWRDVFIHRFVQIIGCEAFQAFTNVDIKGEYIRHNLTRVENYGVVQVPEPTGNVPAWLVTAMKTLANWPSGRSSGSATQAMCHANYPGFENDVFKLISDYFTSFCQQPLLTFELYDAFITTFIRAELFDFNARLYSAKTTSASRSRLCHQLNLPFTTAVGPNRTPQPNDITTEEQYPFNASDSVENLIMDILTPATLRDMSRRGRGITSKIQPKRIIPVPMKRTELTAGDGVSMNPMEDSVLRAVPEPMSAKSFNADKYRNPFFFETAFTGGNSPVTRVVSETELKSTFCTLPRKGQTVQIGPMTTPPRFAYENPNLELSASDMIYHPRYSRVLKSNIGCGNQTPTNHSFYNYSNPSDSSGLSSESSFYRNVPNRSHSSVNLSDATRDRSPYVPGINRFIGRNPQGIAAEYAKSPSKSARRTLDYYYGADACVPGLMTPEGKRMAVAAFRLLTLLLPPSLRKHLQVLLRFMSKTAKTEKLMLDVAVSTRALIINTFFKKILNCTDPAEFDELLALRIVTFMVDNDSEIFAISEEDELIRQVEEIISEEQVTKVPVKEPTPPRVLSPVVKQDSKKSSSSITKASSKPKSKSKLNRLSYENKENENVQLQYCSRISIDEYEDQKLGLKSGTSQSLRSLLDFYINDPTIDDSFRKKKLIEFRDEYPHIFYEKYGDAELQTLNDSIKEEKRKERKPFAALLKPFQRK